MSSALTVRAAAGEGGGGGGGRGEPSHSFPPRVRLASPVHLPGFMNYVSPGISRAYLCARAGPVEEADRLNRMTLYIYANTPLEPGLFSSRGALFFFI